MSKAFWVEQLFFRVPSCVLDRRGADLKGPGLARPGVARAAQAVLGLGRCFRGPCRGQGGSSRAWAGPGCFHGPYRGHYGRPKPLHKATLGRDRMRGLMDSERFFEDFRMLFAAPSYGVVCVRFCGGNTPFSSTGSFRGLTGVLFVCFSRSYRGPFRGAVRRVFRGASWGLPILLFAGFSRIHIGVFAFREPALADCEMGVMGNPGPEWARPQWALPSGRRLLGLDGAHWALMGQPSVGWALGAPSLVQWARLRWTWPWGGLSGVVGPCVDQMIRKYSCSLRIVLCA